jgi:hypothetical protein
VFTKNGIRTLVNVIIADPTYVDLLLDLAQLKDLLLSIQIKPKK